MEQFRIHAFQEVASPDFADAQSSDDHLEKLFAVFEKIEVTLTELENQDEDAEQEETASGLLETQSAIIATAANLEATTLTGLLYKLALWRLDAAELDSDTSELSRADSIAMSVFEDLVKMTGNDILLGYVKNKANRSTT